MIDTAETAVTGFEVWKNPAPRPIFMAATHALFSGSAIERLKDAPVEKIIVTDTVPTQRAQQELGDKLVVVSAAEKSHRQ